MKKTDKTRKNKQTKTEEYPPFFEEYINMLDKCITEFFEEALANAYNKEEHIEIDMDIEYTNNNHNTPKPEKTEPPLTDLIEYKNEIKILTQLPGTKKEDLKITIKEDKITIKEKNKQIKQIKLPTKINTTTTKINHNNNTLEITMQKL